MRASGRSRRHLRTKSAVQQRAYRAPCPGCGAPVEFRSAQSTHAVCAYCHSTVVREGDKLTRLGKMAELFDDHSPLRLLVSGSIGKNAFTLVGRLQYKYDEGSWSEWHALLDDGSTAWLSEDNGAYVFMRPTSLSREVPAQETFRPGLKTSINGKPFSVASNESVALIAAASGIFSTGAARLAAGTFSAAVVKGAAVGRGCTGRRRYACCSLVCCD